MKQQYILAIDQGTSSSRAIIFNRQSQIVSQAQKELASNYPAPGWIEQDPIAIWESVLAVVFESLAKAQVSIKAIAAIGITNQRETTIVWDKASGKPVYPAIVWQSRQTRELCEQVRQQGLAPLIKEKTGLLIDPYFSASKIRWILDQVPAGQKRAEQGELLFGTVDSWLVYQMTAGKLHLTDVSNASRTLLMDINTLAWDSTLCDIWQIPMKMLPTIKPTSAIYGTTAATVFQAEVPIGAVVGDQQAALFGQRCFEPGMVKNTYGTGCFMLMNTGNKPQLSQYGLLATVAWQIGTEVVYALEGSVFVAGAALQWLRDGLEILKQTSDSEAIASRLADNGGVYIVPAFTGLGAPYWDEQAQGAIFGLTRGTTRAELIRATLESLAYQTYDILTAMEADTALKIIDLRVDGGASANKFLLQWQADLLQKPVILPPILETTALGAAYLAGLACGYWQNKSDLLASVTTSETIYPMLSKSESARYLANWRQAIQATQLFKPK